ncbi:OmpH family outer membrane protein [Pelagibacterales bacterium SAG-MED03]|nr:OmpH family outer membrane protein [Pelagibacterales bacterium SAG-MED03]
MIYLKKFLVSFVIYFFSYLNASANENIVFIDLDLLLKKSEFGKSILMDLNNQKNNDLEMLKSKNEKLKLKEKEIKKKTNILKAEDLKKEIDLLKKDIIDFKNYKANVQKKFENNRKNQIISFFKTVNPIIKSYVNENSIQLVINKKNVFMGNKNLDITDSIINKINKEIK